eukprot:PhM_4_TR11603/c0_g1_i1/m.60675
MAHLGGAQQPHRLRRRDVLLGQICRAFLRADLLLVVHAVDGGLELVATELLLVWLRGVGAAKPVHRLRRVTETVVVQGLHALRLLRWGQLRPRPTPVLFHKRTMHVLDKVALSLHWAVVQTEQQLVLARAGLARGAHFGETVLHSQEVLDFCAIPVVLADSNEGTLARVAVFLWFRLRAGRSWARRLAGRPWWRRSGYCCWSRRQRPFFIVFLDLPFEIENVSAQVSDLALEPRDFGIGGDGCVRTACPTITAFAVIAAVVVGEFVRGAGGAEGECFCSSFMWSSSSRGDDVAAGSSALGACRIALRGLRAVSSIVDAAPVRTPVAVRLWCRRRNVVSTVLSSSAGVVMTTRHGWCPVACGGNSKKEFFVRRAVM